MICYDKNDIKDLKNHEDKYYMPNALFDTMQYKLVLLDYTIFILHLDKYPIQNLLDLNLFL